MAGAVFLHSSSVASIAVLLFTSQGKKKNHYNRGTKITVFRNYKISDTEDFYWDRQPE